MTSPATDTALVRRARSEVCKNLEYLTKRAEKKNIDQRFRAAVAMLRSGDGVVDVAELKDVLRLLDVILNLTGRGTPADKGGELPDTRVEYLHIEATYGCPQNNCERLATRPPGTSPVPTCAIHRELLTRIEGR
jgi:hypothetical protein